MRKLIFVMIAMGALLLAGCTSSEETISLAQYQGSSDVSDITDITTDEDDTDDATNERTATTHAYTTLTYTGETAMYKYLDSYEISGNGFGYTVYLPGKEGALDNGAATSSLHGVTMAYEIGNVGSKGMYDILSDAYKTEKERIGNLPNTKDVEVPDAISGDEWALQEIDFKTADGETEYACYSYMKVDMIDDLYVSTRVTLMGNEIDDDTKSVLTEAVTAAGITVEDVVFGEVK